jgi:hypothetical protein
MACSFWTRPSGSGGWLRPLASHPPLRKRDRTGVPAFRVPKLIPGLTAKWTGSADFSARGSKKREWATSTVRPEGGEAANGPG